MKKRQYRYYCKIEDNWILFDSVDTSMIILLQTHGFKILLFNSNLIILAFIQNRVYTMRIVPFFFFYSLARPFFFRTILHRWLIIVFALFRHFPMARNNYMFESSQIFSTVFRFVSFLYFSFFFVFENNIIPAFLFYTVF